MNLLGGNFFQFISATTALMGCLLFMVPAFPDGALNYQYPSERTMRNKSLKKFSNDVCARVFHVDLGGANETMAVQETRGRQKNRGI